MEDVCSDLVRFLHSEGDPTRFGDVRIDREYGLGGNRGFADLRVEPRGELPYFVEVKHGYDAATLIAHLQRKYSGLEVGAPFRVVLVVDTARHPDWAAVERALRAALPPEAALDIWNEQRLHELMDQCFGGEIPSIGSANLVALRERIDEGKDRLAFGDAPQAGYAERVLRQNLLWHFGTWRLRELRHRQGHGALAQLVPPGVYERVVVLMADLSSFSSYVRDTPDEAVVRQSLTNFYAKARYQVINAGGMLEKFVGDEVVALFGIPDRRPGCVEDAVRTAFRLLDIGASVSNDWQRKIDHLQPGGGAHIAMAMGRVQVVSMRALDDAHLTTIGDCLNIAARLLPLAAQGQIVVSNVLRNALRSSAYEFEAREPLEAHNVGTIQPWELRAPSGVPLNGPGLGSAGAPSASGPAVRSTESQSAEHRGR